MDTNRLKRFAQEARKMLLSGVAQRLSTLGITKDCITERPQVMGGGATFQGKTVSLDFVNRWQSIAHNVESRGYRVVVEEVAYTWFNRLVAIRIMAKNGLVAPLLRFESESVHIPQIVTEARHGRLPRFTAEQQAQWYAIADDDAKTDEQFMLLISAWCDNNPIINAAFGSLDDQSAMLIPANILKDDGFVDMLNQADYLTDADYRSPELIGWLYQFYISERKDEVFSKKGKYDSDEIPAATQIFTVNWIVKYMVQNTLGRLYLDANPWETELQKDWKYLVEPGLRIEDSGFMPSGDTVTVLDLESLRTGDLACGSGHILNEQFDILYSMYINDGYSPRNAIESILRNNIVGIDIDLRARQLATFSLLLKSCQIDRSLASAPVLPRVYSMPHIEAVPTLEYPDPKIKEDVEACFKLMLDAETLGSIMKFDISDATRQWIQAQADGAVSALTNCYNIILALTEKYDALAMNPPYMPTNKNDVLSAYVNRYYKEGKADLFAVFMQLGMDLLRDRGLLAMINMQSWMFLSSYEGLRKLFLDTYTLRSMLHLGPRTFDELSGEVVQNTAFVFEKLEPTDATCGTYYRLVDGKNSADKCRLMLEAAAGVYYPNVPQKNFKKVPGFAIGYWVGESIIDSFLKYSKLGDLTKVKSGLSTGDNERFLRIWHEISKNKLFDKYSSNYVDRANYKWIPYSKGGGVQKWYGNLTLVVNWENEASEIRDLGLGVFRNEGTYFHEGITWSGMSSSFVSYRYIPDGFVYDSNKGPMIFTDSSTPFRLPYLLGFLNTKISNVITTLLNPTVSTQIGDLVKIPINYNQEEKITNLIESITNTCVSISKSDWDAHETSWDFEENELVAISKGGIKDLREAVALYKAKWERMFTQLHRNEEELNRRFIEIYGLQDELDYHVPFDEITILQQGEIDHAKTMPVYTVGPNGEQEVGYRLHWNDDVLIKQLISYAVGCMMGRYSIDKPGLVLANQGDGVQKFYEIIGNSRFDVDDDGIVPLMADNMELTDNAPLRFKKWLEAAFGADNLVENVNYIQRALGTTIEAYFQTHFWRDHKRMYQNRPIYWLFASRRGAFQCIAYMHRMDAYTPERIRTRYLLPHIDWLKRRQEELQQRGSALNAAERRDLDTIARQIADCLEYHERLHVVADAQQPIDLDDGVVANYAKLGDVLAKLK